MRSQVLYRTAQVRAAHNSPPLTTSATLLNVRHRTTEFVVAVAGAPALFVGIVMVGKHARP